MNNATLRNSGVTYSLWMVWFLLISLCMAPLLLLMQQGAAGPAYLLTGLIELLLLVPTAVYFAIARTPRQVIFGHAPSWGQVLCSVGIALVLVPGVVFLSMAGRTLLTALGATLPDSSLPVHTYPQLLLSMAVLGITAAVAEEPLFRTVLLQGIGSAGGKTRAIVLSALLFALSHGSADGLLTLFVAGLVLGLVRWQTASLWPCLIIHAVYNAGAVLQDFLLTQNLHRLPPALTGIYAESVQDMLYVTGMWALLAIPCAALLVLLFVALRRVTPRAHTWGSAPWGAKSTVDGLTYLPGVLLVVLLFASALLSAFLL